MLSDRDREAARLYMQVLDQALISLGRRPVWVARLIFVHREVASGEMIYEIEVGGVFELRDDQISRLRAFPSPEEAQAAALDG